MPADGRRLLAGYRAQDAALVAKGWHPTSPRFMAELERFWLSGKRRLVLRCGRQSGKSTTMARVAVATALYGAHRIAAGSRGVVVFVSVRLKDANERLHNVQRILDVLRIGYHRADGDVELTDAPVVISSYASSFRGSVGMTAVALFEDETSRWLADNSENPAKEIDAALTPALVTQPNARIYTPSAPMGLADFHAERMALGETEDQCVAEGPSWAWNPTITREMARSLQPDPKLFAREFEAIPSESASPAFDADDVHAAAAHDVTLLEKSGRSIVSMDMSDGRHDSAIAVEMSYFLRPNNEPHLAKWARTPDGRVLLPAFVRPYVDELSLPDAGRCERVFDDEITQAEVAASSVIGSLQRKDTRDAIENPRAQERAPMILGVRNMISWDGAFAKRGVDVEDILDGVTSLARRVGARDILGDQYSSLALEGGFRRRGLRFQRVVWTSAVKTRAVMQARALMRGHRLAFFPGPQREALVREFLGYQEKVSASGVSFDGRRGLLDDRVAAVLTGIAGDLEQNLVPDSPIQRAGRRKFDWRVGDIETEELW